MTTSDLREAAKFIVAKLTASGRYRPDLGYDDLPPFETAAVSLANHLLAANPADDVEAIDETWLRSVGGYQLFTDRRFVCVTKNIGYDCHVIGIGTENFVGWQVVNSYPFPGLFADVGVIKTRGQLRRLCAALGIELKEATP